MRAEVLVYDLSFSNTGPSVNYSFLQGGYLVVDYSSKAVTSIVTLTDPQTDLLYFTTGLLSGTYMEMIAEGSGQEYGVISSASGSSTDNISFQILGKTNRKTDIGAGNSLSIAHKLKGYLLASAAESSSNSTSSNSTSSGNFTYGFAGASQVTSKLQSNLTEEANNLRLDAAATIENLATVLENRGVVPEPTATPTATP